jgi:hypothetical protein
LLLPCGIFGRSIGRRRVILTSSQEKHGNQSERSKTSALHLFSLKQRQPSSFQEDFWKDSVRLPGHPREKNSVFYRAMWVTLALATHVPPRSSREEPRLGLRRCTLSVETDPNPRRLLCPRCQRAMQFLRTLRLGSVPHPRVL